MKIKTEHYLELSLNIIPKWSKIFSCIPSDFFDIEILKKFFYNKNINYKTFSKTNEDKYDFFYIHENDILSKNSIIDINFFITLFSRLEEGAKIFFFVSKDFYKNKKIHSLCQAIGFLHTYIIENIYNKEMFIIVLEKKIEYKYLRKKKKLSIVLPILAEILNRNYIRNCLSFLENNATKYKVEVILIFNGTEDVLPDWTELRTFISSINNFEIRSIALYEKFTLSQCLKIGMELSQAEYLLWDSSFGEIDFNFFFDEYLKMQDKQKNKEAKLLFFQKKEYTKDFFKKIFSVFNKKINVYSLLLNRAAMNIVRKKILFRSEKIFETLRKKNLTELSEICFYYAKQNNTRTYSKDNYEALKLYKESNSLNELKRRVLFQLLFTLVFSFSNLVLILFTLFTFYLYKSQYIYLFQFLYFIITSFLLLLWIENFLILSIKNIYFHFKGNLSIKNIYFNKIFFKSIYFLLFILVFYFFPIIFSSPYSLSFSLILYILIYWIYSKNVFFSFKPINYS